VTQNDYFGLFLELPGVKLRSGIYRKPASQPQTYVETKLVMHVHVILFTLL